MTTNTKLLVGLAVVLLIGCMFYFSISGSAVSCEVCIEFRGGMECRKASGKDAGEAQTAAASTACSLLSGGVTDGIACRNTEPKSVSCENR
jgi:hypothetical protein